MGIDLQVIFPDGIQTPRCSHENAASRDELDRRFGNEAMPHCRTAVRAFLSASVPSTRRDLPERTAARRSRTSSKWVRRLDVDSSLCSLRYLVVKDFLHQGNEGNEELRPSLGGTKWKRSHTDSSFPEWFGALNESRFAGGGSLRNCF